MADKPPLSKAYKNELAKAIQQAGLNLANFSATDDVVEGRAAFRIEFKPANLTFVVRTSPQDPLGFDYLYDRFPAGQANQGRYYPRNKCCSFAVVQSSFKNWLTQDIGPAIYEAQLPDLWADVAKTGIGREASDAAPKSPFTDEEKRQIASALSNFRVSIVETFHPNDEQLADISTQLEYLVSATDRLNKFDWRGVAIATLFSIITTLTLDTERGRQLYDLFHNCFRNIAHLLN